MDTPAITPEIPAQSSNSSSTEPCFPGSNTDSAAPQSQSHTRIQSQAHPPVLPRFLPQQTKQQQPKIQGTTTTAAMDSNFFAKSLRPLSPPESPFAFDAAFSAKPQQQQSSPPATTSAPASPHFALPALVRPTSLRFAKPPTPKSSTATAKREQRGWAKNVQSKPAAGADNPYFPSIEEQERKERWARDQARFHLPPSSPVPIAAAPPQSGVYGADPFSHANSSSSASASLSASESSSRAASPGENKAGFRLDLGEVRRRMALRGCKGVPESPESFVGGEEGKGEEEEYRRRMARHLVERMSKRRGRSVEREREREEGRFQW